MKTKPKFGPLTRGEGNYNVKLNDDLVRDIRRMAKAGIPQKDIAKLVRMSPPQVSRIVRREAWPHVR